MNPVRSTGSTFAYDIRIRCDVPIDVKQNHIDVNKIYILSLKYNINVHGDCGVHKIKLFFLLLSKF